MSSMEITLNDLVGKKIWSIWSAASMLVAHIGEQISEYSEVYKKEVTFGQYSIHIQCSYRLIHLDKIVLGYQDQFVNGDEKASSESEQSTEPVSYFVGQKKMISREILPLVITGWTLGRMGFLRLELGSRSALEIFPDSSAPDESWRLLENKLKRHWVFDHTGFQSPDDSSNSE